MPRPYRRRLGRRSYRKRRPGAKARNYRRKFTRYTRALVPHGTRGTKQIGLPSKLSIKMRYQDTWFNMSTASGGGYQTSNFYRANGPYDPDYTGVGVQPYSYDELSALYTYGRVYASKIKCTFYPSAALATASKQTAIIWPSMSGSMPANHELPDLKQARGCRYIQLSSDRLGNRPLVIKNYMTTRRMYRDIYNSRDNDASFLLSTVPTAQWWWAVVTDTADSAADCTIHMDVEVTYYMKLFCRDILDQS